ncbi:MAG: ferritin-like domain-containing protein, partial [Bdellovibrionota bacterium]
AALQNFSQVEIDSGWQSLHVIPLVPDSRTKKVLFLHALEEFRHGELFDSLCTRLSPAYLSRPAFRRKPMLRGGGGPDALLDFMAGTYVGERDVNEDFRYYSQARVDPEIRAAFSSIMAEEQGHEEEADGYLVRFAGGDRRKVRLRIWKHSFLRLYRLYTGLLQELGEIPLSILLTGAYFVLGPFLYLPLKRRLFLPKEDQLAIMKAQITSLKTELNRE